MLDTAIIEQLKGVYQALENEVSLVIKKSEHANYKDLKDLAESLASTSSKIAVVHSDEPSKLPELSIHYKGQPTGINFVGYPGGHEFTSLVLAILHTDGKGKLPDSAILNRIKRIKGPVEIKTYISLSCENCPEVVQALNLMCLYHPNFKHTMVDGGLVQEEVASLGIQGVPSVVKNEKLLSSGKTNLVELIAKLEAEYGTEEQEINPEDLDLGSYDVVVVGAGPGGASAAIYSARKGLKTAIIAERVGGQVQDTKGIENLISVPYTEGPQLAAQLASHISEYDIKLLEHRRVKNVINGDLKKLELESGEYLQTKSLIVATGAKWRELGVPGEKEHIGRGVAFCPHCDGPIFKGKDIAVIGGGNSGVEAAIDLAGIVKSIKLIEFGAELKADTVLVNKVKTLSNVEIITNAKTTQVIGDNGKVVGLEYEDRTNNESKRIDLEGVFVQIGLVPNSSFIKDVVETNRFGEIVVDNKCRTNVAGIYAAGDVTTVPYKQIIISMGEGAKAALTSFEDIMLK
ncbi:MAG: alkyl hydroperoxide reductase subunit F [Bacteriovoracaceae bacterium]